MFNNMGKRERAALALGSAGALILIARALRGSWSSADTPHRSSEMLTVRKDRAQTFQYFTSEGAGHVLAALDLSTETHTVRAQRRNQLVALAQPEAAPAVIISLLDAPGERGTQIWISANSTGRAKLRSALRSLKARIDTD